jgi:hypothetical protein
MLGSVVRGHCACYAVPGNSKATRAIPDPGDPALAPGATAPQPADPPELGTPGPPRRPVATPGLDHASMAEHAVRRSYPRQEPSAVIPLAGICAGAARKGGPYRDRSVPWEPGGAISPRPPGGRKGLR